MGGYAWVTLATNDSYSLGALVLAHSLRKSRTAHKAVVLITPAVSQPMREQLQTVFDVVQVVDVLDSKDEAHLALMQRPELGITFTKIHCWKLVEFDKCVFLDADTLVVRNCDELFEREEFSAAPDVSWPDCFNSGVFVFKPSVQTFNELLQFAVEKGSFDGGDQGLLNQFFSSWATEDIKKHLPFVYNLTSVAAYSYIPAFKHYGSETRIVHFIGAGKPWLQQLDPATRTITPTSGSEHLAPLLQQWWDLFCEKVHPNLNKNLESNNDGMSHPPVAACSNSLPIALTDDSQTPRLIEPCTPYREKDDFRQYNLPYQPFHVKGSSGELLNVEFLLTSAARPTSPEVVLDEERREGDGMEEKAGQEETDRRNQNEQNERKSSDSATRESESKKEAESSDHTAEMQQLRIEERIGERKEAETVEQDQQQESQAQSKEPEQPPPTAHPFDYDSFFPDETCINKYLEQNVITYQPYDSHSHHQPHENHQHDSSQNSISSHDNSTEITITDPVQPQEDPAPSLPRFLTIPENDKRQSGNTETQPETKQPDLHATADPPQVEPPTNSPETLPRQETVEEKRELTKSKSMPYLRYDVTEVPSSGCIWKSQPNVNVDPNRKYSMPKLKPILPRQNSLSRSVPYIAPKVTLYTEFLMSAEYKDPADLPKDKVGFVETLIHRKGQLRRTKSAADIGDKFGPLPYSSSPEMEQPAILKKSPSLHLDSELYDLSQCKRQMGNKPKAKGADRRKGSSHPLPALKPLVPPKDKKSTLIKKRKSKELSPGDGGREKIFKKDAKMPKQRKRECKTTPRNVSEAGTGNSVDEILTRLREFSKNYQHFFGVQPQPGDKTLDFKKAEEVVTPVSGPIQTPGERKPEKEGPTLDSKFTHFRNYVKEKSRTSQKGLLSIQDLVSKQDDEGDAKASGETLDSCSESRRGKAGDVVASALERKDSAKGDSSVERETPGKDVNVRNEVSEGSRGADKPCRTLANGENLKDNSEGTVKSALHSSDEVETNRLAKNSGSSISCSAETSESKVTLAKHSEEDIPEPENIPVVSGTGNAVVSCQEGDAQTNGLEREKTRSEKVSVGKTAEKLQKLSLGEKNSLAAVVEFNEDLELTNKDRDLEKTTQNTYNKPTKLHRLKRNTLEQPPPSSCLDGTIPNGNGCPEVSGTDFEPAEPVRLTLPGKAPAESASKSSPKGIFSESNQLTSRTEGKLTVEETNGVKSGEKLAGKEEEKPARKQKPKSTAEVLSDTPCSSRVPLPTSKNNAVGIADEVLTKATLQQNQTSAPPRPTPRKARKPTSPPKKPPRHRNSPPDETCPPVGGKTSPPSPSIPQNGKALPESEEDMTRSSGIAGAIAQLSLEAGSGPGSGSVEAASAAHQEYLRRQNWETGNMDYMGRDSFDNIWSKICKTLEEKEPEEAGPAAESPKQSKQPSDPSATIPAKEATTPQPPPIAVTPATPSAAPHECPEYIQTLPGEPAAGPVEDDEIIFSKPDNRQSCLTNIKEAEEDGKESSALGDRPADAGKVKLSDILQPEMSSGPKESSGSEGKGERVVEEAKTPVQTMTEKVGAPADEKKESPQAVKVQPEVNKEKVQPAAKVEEASTPTEKAVPAPDDKKETSQAAKTQSEPNKVEDKIAAKAVDQTAAKVQKANTPAEKVEDKTAAKVEEASMPTEKAGAPPDDKKETSQAAKTQSEPNKVEDKIAAKVQEANTPTEKAGAAAEEKREVPQTAKVQPEPKKLEEQTGAKVQEAKIPVQTTEKATAPADEKKEVPQAAKIQPEPKKPEDKTVAVDDPQVRPGASKPETPDDKPETDSKTESCTTVAIPSPPIHFPGAPFSEKDKKAQARRKPQEPAEEKFEPIPLPPPDTPPTEEPRPKPSDPAKDQGKQKKGVFTKILEMVGVAPKEKSEDEIPKSVFYDVKGAAPSKQELGEEENAKQAEKQAPAAETQTKVDDVGGVKPEETPKVAPPTQSNDGEVSLSKPEETQPPEVEHHKPQEGAKVKPPRNISPKDPGQSSKNSIQITQKARSPSPKLTLPQHPPATATTTPAPTPTPPPQPDLPLTKTSGLLKVDETIPETPPVPDAPKEATEESVKGKVLAEVDDIIGKAKTEVEARLQERRTPDDPTEATSDLINAMKLIMAAEQGAQSPEVQVEELRVTTEEERMRHKGEVVSSKLSDQILKAIPPPRRKAISEGAASTSGIPKAGPAPEQKAPPAGEPKKAGKPSSIPVPPPRSRGKPAQPPPSRGRGRK